MHRMFGIEQSASGEEIMRVWMSRVHEADRPHVNLEMVPVVEGEANGRAGGDISKENFYLYDRSKPLGLTRCACAGIETASARVAISVRRTTIRFMTTPE